METGKTLLAEWVIDPLKGAADTFWSFAPSVLSAIIILVIGWLIAKLLEELVNRLLKALTLDKLADQLHVSTALAKGGIRRKFSELVGVIVYWIVVLAFAMTALNALNLTVAAELLQTIVAFLPNVVAALFILILGIFAAAFLAATVRTAASTAGILQAQLLGQITQMVVVIFAAVASLQQLNVPFFGEVFLIILGGISLGCALAFGLGGRDLAARWLSDVADQISGKKR